jgi:hypothetical protein
MYQWSRIEGPEISSRSYSHLLLNRGAQNALEKGSFFSEMVLGKLNIHKYKGETRSLSYVLKINSK